MHLSWRPRSTALLATAMILLAMLGTALFNTAIGAAAADPVSGNASSGDQPLQALMSQLAQRKHGHVTFVEQHFLHVLNRPVESSGELLYDAPDRLEKRTLKPKPETLVLEHGVITAQRGRRTYVLNLSDYPDIVPLVDSMRATLAGDVDALKRNFTVSLDGDVAHWTLKLLPADSTVGKTVTSITIAGDDTNIHTVEILQHDGDRSLLTIGPEVAQ